MRNEEILPWQLAKIKSFLEFQPVFIVYLKYLILFFNLKFFYGYSFS